MWGSSRARQALLLLKPLEYLLQRMHQAAAWRRRVLRCRPVRDPAHASAPVAEHRKESGLGSQAQQSCLTVNLSTNSGKVRIRLMPEKSVNRSLLKFDQQTISYILVWRGSFKNKRTLICVSALSHLREKSVCKKELIINVLWARTNQLTLRMTHRRTDYVNWEKRKRISTWSAALWSSFIYTERSV